MNENWNWIWVQLLNDFGIIKRLEAKSSVNNPCVINPRNVLSDSSNLDWVTVLGQCSGWNPQPRWALQRGQVAIVQANPGNQEKRLSAGQCSSTSAFLNVITSNCLSCGFSNSWIVILLPPSRVSLRVESARRLGTKRRSEPFATSCPHALHSISGSVLPPSRCAFAAHASPNWIHGWIIKNIIIWYEVGQSTLCISFSADPMLLVHGKITVNKQALPALRGHFMQIIKIF